MSKRTFKGGVHPLYLKELSRERPIRRLQAPAQVTIPLIQHVGPACVPTVKAGDAVRVGTLIGSSEKFISAPIHSSVSGKVKVIKKMPHPVLGKCDSVLIESDGMDEVEALPLISEQGPKDLNPDLIRKIVKEAGLVGLGGAAFPTHVKLTPPKEKTVETFVLNGAECEPYLTCDERVMIEKSKEVMEGVLLIMKALGVKKGFVAIEDNKPEAVRAMRSALNEIRNTKYEIQIEVLHTKYPQGGEKQLINAILKRKVPPGGLPFDVGCIVDNVQTALTVYEALYARKPLYERVVTVTGDAIKEPSNLLVRIGTPISYIIENCGGLKMDPKKIIMGGPMMGIAQYSNETPVIKGTSGVLLMSAESAQFNVQQYCIRCGKCIEVCPVNLVPTEIAKSAENGRFDMAEELHVQDCMECGGCAYVCPSAIPLVQLIKHAKRSLICKA